MGWIQRPIPAYQFVHLISACVICTGSSADPGGISGRCSDFWTGYREEPHLDVLVSVMVKVEVTAVFAALETGRWAALFT